MAVAQTGDTEALLRVRGLVKHYAVRKGVVRREVAVVRAVDGVDFEIGQGETLGLVGESGCGKTTTGRCVIRAVDPTDGEVLYRSAGGQQIDLASVAERDLRPLRREMQMIFQDPYSSLNPRMTLLDIVGEYLTVNKLAKGRQLRERVADLLQLVGLRPEYMSRYPHAFSGGERQRIGIARALSLDPRLIICDEPVSALDVSVQAQILNLLQDLQAKLHLTYLFIAHDLSVVRHISDRVAVMYVGKIVETARTAELYASPSHPYTEALLSAVPRPEPRAQRRRIPLQGEVADASNVPSGCYFHPRCRYCQDVCRQEQPPLREVTRGRHVACHLAEGLSLAGVDTRPGTVV